MTPVPLSFPARVRKRRHVETADDREGEQTDGVVASEAVGKERDLQPRDEVVHTKAAGEVPRHLLQLGIKTRQASDRVRYIASAGLHSLSLSGRLSFQITINLLQIRYPEHLIIDSLALLRGSVQDEQATG